MGNSTEARAYRVSPLAVCLYTLWTLGLGMGILRLRVDHDIGNALTLLAIVALTFALCVLGWYKIFRPWGLTVTEDAQS